MLISVWSSDVCSSDLGRFGRDILGELGQSLRSDDPCKPALAAPAHQVRHRSKRSTARLVRYFARRHGCKHLRLVNDDERGIPVIAWRVEERGKEGGGAAHLRFQFKRFKVQDHGGAMFANARGDPRDLPLVIERKSTR